MGGFVRGGPGQGTTWRLAADPRTNCLIVRGTDQDLRTAADLIALLDVAADKPVSGIKNHRAFRLRYANANEVAQVVEQLGIGALIVPAPKAGMVIASGPESALKEIAEVIEAVDVQGKAAGPKTGEPGAGKP
jgi:type II secretory pathway component GspD/PulD (secretin)